MQSLTLRAKELDRRIKGVLREVDAQHVTRTEQQKVQQLKLACNEVKLDMRDYEYAQTRTEQLKWAKIARHNLGVLEKLSLELDTVFSPADIAELSAKIDAMRALLQ